MKTNKPRGNTWVQFTKRTDDPKLMWIQLALLAASIESRRHGESFHGPILQVRHRDLDRAWACLPPDVDDAPDDAKKFQTPEVLRALAQEGERS